MCLSIVLYFYSKKKNIIHSFTFLDTTRKNLYIFGKKATTTTTTKFAFPTNVDPNVDARNNNNDIHNWEYIKKQHTDIYNHHQQQKKWNKRKKEKPVAKSYPLIWKNIDNKQLENKFKFFQQQQQKNTSSGYL